MSEFAEPPRRALPRQTKLLGLALAATAICATGPVLTPRIAPLNIITALLLVLVLPGYALDGALLLESRRRPAGERVATVLGASIAVAVLGGLALNWLPGGLQATQWRVLLGAFTAAATVCALARRRGATGTVQPTAGSFSLRWSTVASAVAVVIILTGAGLVTARSVRRPDGPGFTQFGAVPSADTHSVTLSVTNNERRTQSYRLAATYNGRMLSSWGGLRLRAGQSWSVSLRLPVSAPGRVLSAKLYIGRSTSAYRSVWVRTLANA